MATERTSTCTDSDCRVGTTSVDPRHSNDLASILPTITTTTSDGENEWTTTMNNDFLHRRGPDASHKVVLTSTCTTSSTVIEDYDNVNAAAVHLPVPTSSSPSEKKLATTTKTEVAVHSTVLHMRGSTITRQPIRLQWCQPHNKARHESLSSPETATMTDTTDDDDDDGNHDQEDTPALLFMWNGEVYQYSDDNATTPADNHNVSKKNAHVNRCSENSLYTTKAGSSTIKEVCKSASDTQLVASMLEEAILCQRRQEPNTASPPDETTARSNNLASMVHRAIASTMGKITNGEFAFCVIVSSNDDKCNEHFILYGRDVLGRKSLLVSSSSCASSCTRTTTPVHAANNKINNNHDNDACSSCWRLCSVATIGSSSKSMNSDCHSADDNNSNNNGDTHTTTATTSMDNAVVWTEVEPGLVFCHDIAKGITTSLPFHHCDYSHDNYSTTDNIILRSLRAYQHEGDDDDDAAAVDPNDDDDKVKQQQPRQEPSRSTAPSSLLLPQLPLPLPLPPHGVTKSMWLASLQLEHFLARAVRRHVTLHTTTTTLPPSSRGQSSTTSGSSTASTNNNVGVLFSGGLDSVVLTALVAHYVLNDPSSTTNRTIIDLLNVSFDDNKSSADRIAALQSHYELERLYPEQEFRLVCIDIAWDEVVHCQHRIEQLMHPKRSTMDFNISTALWFAARGTGRVVRSSGAAGCDDECGASNDKVKSTKEEAYTSTCRILLMGMGADEQMGGYGRHRKCFEQHGGYERLRQELDMDMGRLWERNLGRDDRLVSDHGKEARFPYLDAEVVQFLASLPLHDVCDFSLPPGVGDKQILRLVAQRLGLETAAGLVKRAIQFGSRIAHVSDKRRFGSRRKATGQSHFRGTIAAETKQQP